MRNKDRVAGKERILFAKIRQLLALVESQDWWGCSCQSMGSSLMMSGHMPGEDREPGSSSQHSDAALSLRLLSLGDIFSLLYRHVLKAGQLRGGCFSSRSSYICLTIANMFHVWPTILTWLGYVESSGSDDSELWYIRMVNYNVLLRRLLLENVTSSEEQYRISLSEQINVS